MPQAHRLFPVAIIGAAPFYHSRLFLVLIGLAALSLMADMGLLAGAVLIH